MFLIHGIYNFRPRRVAFRRDYCRTCQAQRLAVRVRSLDVLHVFWIPVLPIGAWRRWFCATCKHSPHAAPGAPRTLKYLAVGFLAVMAVTMWANMPRAERWFVWTLRVAFGVSTMVALMWALRHKVEPDVRRALAAVEPFRGSQCPVCGVREFSDSPYWTCRVCGVRHEPLSPTR